MLMAIVNRSTAESALQAAALLKSIVSDSQRDIMEFSSEVTMATSRDHRKLVNDSDYCLLAKRADRPPSRADPGDCSRFL